MSLKRAGGSTITSRIGWRIEICGGIASGKTTLCNLLARNPPLAINENFRANPFWALFYNSPQLHAFETEITFLLQHYSQVKLPLQTGSNIVCDFAFVQDDAYAHLNLVAGQLETFMAVHSQVLKELGKPLLLVHLACSADVELERIRRRNREEEKALSLDYLEALNTKISEYVAHIRQSTDANIVTINSGENDFAADAVTQARISHLIDTSLAIHV